MASDEHKKLAEFIKNVHIGLRVNARKVGAEEAWDAHCQERDTLKVYADSMLQLATKHWKGCDNELPCTNSRIKWVVNHCLEYFVKGGREKALMKESKREEFMHQTEHSLTSELQNDHLVPDNLKLLDVGSCYNPFKTYPLFTVVPIDLIPAVSDVIEADFLKVRVHGEELDLHETNEKRVLQAIPKNHFDVVVFSLLLEYMPSCQQRYTCCKKAYDVLKPEGLLFIITPDSRHATANSTLMKNWRICLAQIGFTRVYYEKLQHIRCMAYRKNLNPMFSQQWALKEQKQQLQSLTVLDNKSYLFNLMKIPQDNTEYETKHTFSEVPDRTDEENLLLADTFTELPLNILGDF